MAWFRRTAPRHVTVSSPSKQSLVAAGTRIHQREAQIMRRLIQPWQTRALSYYEDIGEIKFAANYVGHAISLLSLFAAEIQEDGEIQTTDNQAVIDALARIQDPGGGKGSRSALQEQYGKLMFLTGEVYLLVSNDPFTGLEQWEMLSTTELRVMDGTIMRYRAPSIMIQNYQEAPDEDFFPLGDDAVVYRLWRRSPVFSGLADSSMQGVLLVCDELLKLTAVVRARVTSRLAGPGVLFLDDAISQTPLEPLGDEDPLNDIILQDLIEAATTAIENEGSAAAAIPVLIRLPVPDGKMLKDLIYHLQLNDPMQLYPETGLREECIRRIAIGLDIPAEVLTGMGDLTHWNAWAVSEDTFKSHLQPLAQQLCSDLTMSYLRPYLRDMGVDGWENFCIDYDATAIINHPDRSAAAMDGYDRRAVSKAALRTALGFTDDDAMPQDELNESLGLGMRDAGLAIYGTPSLRTGSELEVAPGTLEVPGAPLPGGPGIETKFPAPGPGGSSSETVKDKPTQPIPGTVIGAGIDIDRFALAAELAVLRARELAGAKVRNYAKKDADAEKAIDGVRPGLVPHTLGPEAVKALCKQTESQLVSGTRSMIEDAMRIFGITDPATIELVVSNVERHAAKTLYDERPAPLPAPLVNRIAAAAKRAKP